MNFLTEKLKMHRDNQVQKLLRQQYNFPPPPYFNVAVIVRRQKTIKNFLQHCPGGKGGNLF